MPDDEHDQPQQDDAGPDATPTDQHPPANAAEQLAQDALDAARAAVSEVETTDIDEGADAQAAISAAQQAVDSIGSDLQDAVGDASAMPIPALDAPSLGAELEEGLDLLSDVNLNVKIELGRTSMYLEDVLRLSEGSVVELDKLAGDPVDVYVNDRHVATGEVLILNDNFCVRINEIISSSPLDQRST